MRRGIRRRALFHGVAKPALLHQGHKGVGVEVLGRVHARLPPDPLADELNGQRRAEPGLGDHGLGAPVVLRTLVAVGLIQKDFAPQPLFFADTVRAHTHAAGHFGADVYRLGGAGCHDVPRDDGAARNRNGFEAAQAELFDDPQGVDERRVEVNAKRRPLEPVGL